MTQKQADYFASKIANDSGFGSKYARNGEEMKGFISRISNELQNDVGKVTVYMPYLLAQGYAIKGKGELSIKPPCCNLTIVALVTISAFILFDFYAILTATSLEVCLNLFLYAFEFCSTVCYLA